MKNNIKKMKRLKTFQLFEKADIELKSKSKEVFTILKEYGLKPNHNESHMEDRTDWYIKIAKRAYADKTADEIIDIIENGNEMLKFNSDEEKKLFKSKWDNVHRTKFCHNDHDYILTSEQGHRVIKCRKCDDTKPI